MRAIEIEGKSAATAAAAAKLLVAYSPSFAIHNCVHWRLILIHSHTGSKVLNQIASATMLALVCERERMCVSA